MSDPRAHKYKSVVAAVNRVLYDDWAPIGFSGGLPEDEYEGYAVRVVSMLVSGASEPEIAEYLLGVETKLIGVSENPEGAKAVASKLVGFREQARAIAL